MKTSIVKINEELCNGCGLCIGPCVEGALVLENGKARVLREELCDGAGVCLDVCPEGALSLEVREAPDFQFITEDPAGSLPDLTEPASPGREALTCGFCQISEYQAYLLSLRHQGRSLWVCSRCLPRLIHG